MLTFPGLKGNANQNHTKIPSHTCYNSYIKNTNTDVGKDAGKKGNFIHCWWECKLVQPLWKTVWRLLKRTRNKSAL
jgi:hypothetical protein